jgi:hypothetical protein
MDDHLACNQEKRRIKLMEYWINIDDQNRGPYTKDQIITLQADGTISDATMACSTDDSSWSTVGQLFPSLSLPGPSPEERETEKKPPNKKETSSCSFKEASIEKPSLFFFLKKNLRDKPAKSTEKQNYFILKKYSFEPSIIRENFQELILQLHQLIVLVLAVLCFLLPSMYIGFSVGSVLFGLLSGFLGWIIAMILTTLWFGVIYTLLDIAENSKVTADGVEFLCKKQSNQHSEH